jgi:PilZ domain
MRIMVQERRQTTDQRIHPRRTSYIIVEYMVKEGSFRDIIRNIGADGMFVNTTRNIAEAQSIVLRFPLFEFDHLVEVNGQVTRCTTNGFAVTFDKPIPGLICKDGRLPEIVHEIDRNTPV